MIYEIIGKIVVTILIMITIAIFFISALLIKELVLNPLIDKLPQWIRTTIALSLGTIILIGLGVLIYYGL